MSDAFEQNVWDAIFKALRPDSNTATVAASKVAHTLAPRVAAAIRAASNDNWPEDAALAALRGEHP